MTPKYKLPKYKSVVHPDPETEFLMRARAVVEETVEFEKSRSRKPVSLFLEWHYPFFDADVQGILKERHPETMTPPKVASWYPIDAYIWAEQHVWIAYDDSPLKDTRLLEEHSSFYLANDLRWFSRLLAAIAAVVERIIDVQRKADVSHETRLQEWRNRYSESEERPTIWLEGTQFRERATKRRKGQGEDPMESVRVTASHINKQRGLISNLGCRAGKLSSSNWMSSWKLSRGCPWTLSRTPKLLNAKTSEESFKMHTVAKRIFKRHLGL